MYTGKAITSLCLWFLWLFVFTAGMLVVDFLIFTSMFHLNMDVRQFRAETAKLPEIASHPRSKTL